MSELLVVEDLKKHFPVTRGIIIQKQIASVKAVDGVSFTVNAGETLGIVGESGCGKSVTALSIMRLVPNPPGRITGGEILFDDGGTKRDLLKISEAEAREIRGDKIAMIFQDPMTS